MRSCVIFIYQLYGILFLWSTGISLAQEVIEAKNKEKFVIKLGGLFTIYNRGSNESCDMTKPLRYSIESAEELLYAIMLINRNETLLPGVELQLDIQADCLTDTIALTEILRWVSKCEKENQDKETNPDRYWGVLGPSTSEVAVPVAKLLGLFNFTQISSGATSSDLSDKQRYPSFFRTVPSDVHQVEAIIKVLNENGWNYVSFIHEDDDYGNAAFDAFMEQIENSSICLAQQHKLTRNSNESHISEIIKRLTAETRSRVVIAFVFELHLLSLFKKVAESGNTEKLQWIGSDSWSEIFFHNCSLDFGESPQIPPVIDGAIVFQPHSEVNELFEDYLRGRDLGAARQNNKYLAMYLAYLNNCTLQENNSNSCLENLTIPLDSPRKVMRSESGPNSLYAFAYALDKARVNLCPDGAICDAFKQMNRTLLLQYLQNITFSYGKAFSQFSFDKSHDGPARYEIHRYNRSDGCWKMIGAFNNGELSFDFGIDGRGNINSTCSNQCGENQYQIIHEEKSCCWHCSECGSNQIFNSSYQPKLYSRQNMETACIDCGESKRPVGQECVSLDEKYLSFNHPLAWAVAAVSSLGFALTLSVVIVYIYFRSTPLIRASGRELSFLILTAIFLTFSVSFLFCVKPSNIICGARRFGIGFCFTFMFASLLVKTIRISVVFNNLGKQLVRDYKLLLKPTPQIIIALLLTAVEVFILVVWFLFLPPEMIVDFSPADSTVRYQFLDCQGLNSQYILVGLAYPILLILVCTFYAVKIRKVPAGFNEAKFIGFAVYTTLVIWMAQLSTYFVQIRSEIEVRDAIYCLCLSLNALVILFALFGPKVYIVLLRPEKNSQTNVMASRKSNESVSQISGGVVANSRGVCRTNRYRFVSMPADMTHDTQKRCPCCTLKTPHIDVITKPEPLSEVFHNGFTNCHGKNSSSPYSSNHHSTTSVESCSNNPFEENNKNSINEVSHLSLEANSPCSKKHSEVDRKNNTTNKEQNCLTRSETLRSRFSGHTNPVFEHSHNGTDANGSTSLQKSKLASSCILTDSQSS